METKEEIMKNVDGLAGKSQDPNWAIALIGKENLSVQIDIRDQLLRVAEALNTIACCLKK